jgi:D-glycero-alpha-D-manno-heptose-7-phosphate kinase
MPILRSIHSRAPVRICDNGGWTDTWFAEHGRVCSIAVSPFAEVTVDVYPRDTREHRITVFAENYGERFVHSPDWTHHPLIEAAISMQTGGLAEREALDITLYSDMPPGASTGTSSAITVALLAALDGLNQARLSRHELAYAAHAVETDLLKRQCGIQDQIAAAYGGVCDIEMFAYPQARVTQIPLAEDLKLELSRRLLLVYLGKSHDSSRVHEMVIRELESAGPDDGRIEALRVLAPRARDALVAGDLNALGRALRDNTDAQARLNPALVGADARAVIEIARSHGVLGWKINGAGGDGGSIALLCGDNDSETRALIRTLEQGGRFRRIPVALGASGVTVWETGPAHIRGR